MFRAPVRLAVVIAGLVLTIGAGYRAFDDEGSLNRERQDGASADAAVGRALELLLDIRGSLHAYVAPGQGLPFWAKRAQENIDALRDTVVSLDRMAAPLGKSMADTLDGIDQLSAAERRAHSYVLRADMLLAGDVVFTEVRDLLAAATNQVDAVRGELKRRHEQRAASLRTEQLTLAAIALGIWMVIAFFLTPTESRPAGRNPAEWRSELKETLAKPVATPAVLVAPVPAAPVPPAEPSVKLASVRQASEICADLSALSDPGALGATLARVNTLLDATGLIVWVASNDGASLSPVATHGFDATLVARIGKVSRDGANLTAAAFRDNTPKVSAPTATAPAALAIAMCGPSGPAGVLSVELKPGQSVDEAKIALASIISAQLATLTMPIPEAAVEMDGPRQAAL